MRIGRFAEKYKVSIDTVRHYMDLGLIIPEKKGGQYYFDDICEKDFIDIIYFKQMGFKLSDIKKIFIFKKLGNLTNYQKDEYYKTIFLNKFETVKKEINELQAVKEKLAENIENLSQNLKHKSNITGIDLSLINILKCFKCKSNLSLDSGEIKNNQIINGKLKCKCGQEYIIENGILIICEKHEQNKNYYENNIIGEYISSTDECYIESLYNGLEWTKRKFSSCDFNNKIILDLGSGSGFFLRAFLNDLPDNCIYIAIDNDIEAHKFLKKMIEYSDIKKNIMFICTDFLEIPLADNSIDLIIDASGTSNYSFYNKEFLLDLIDNLVKKDAYLYGAYILFQNFSPKSTIKEEYRKNFRLNYVKDKIEKLGYKKIDDGSSKVLDKGGIYESFFVEGEKIFHYKFIGKR